MRRLLLRPLLVRLDVVLPELRVPERRVPEPPELRVPELRVLELRRLAPEDDRELVEPDEELPPFTPALAPRTTPRAAPNTTSPAFIAPANPYTAPCRMRPRARGDITAAVAATAIPISLSIMSSRATFPPGLVVKLVPLRYPWAR